MTPAAPVNSMAWRRSALSLAVAMSFAGCAAKGVAPAAPTGDHTTVRFEHVVLNGSMKAHAFDLALPKGVVEVR